MLFIQYKGRMVPADRAAFFGVWGHWCAFSSTCFMNHLPAGLYPAAGPVTAMSFIAGHVLAVLYILGGTAIVWGSGSVQNSPADIYAFYKILPFIFRWYVSCCFFFFNRDGRCSLFCLNCRIRTTRPFGRAFQRNYFPRSVWYLFSPGYSGCFRL